MNNLGNLQYTFNKLNLGNLQYRFNKLVRSVRARHNIHLNTKYLQFCHKNSLIQFWYGFRIYAGNVLIGTAFGFSATSVPGIRHDDVIEATPDDLAWFTSVLYLPSILGCLISGYLLDKYGRRLLSIWSMLPFIVGWVYTAISLDITNLVVARAITGFATGMCAPPSRVFAAEISMPHMRSIVGNFLSLSIAFGIMFQALMGALISWRNVCYIYVGYSVIIMVSHLQLPESPYFLLMTHNDSTPALEALQKFRAADYDVQEEIDEMEQFKRLHNIHSISSVDQIKALFRRNATAPFFIIMISMVFTQFSGISVMYTYTVDILEDSISSVDSYIGNVILGSTRLFGSIICSIALFKISRRKMAIISGLGMSFSFYMLFLHLMMTGTATIVPMICTTSYVFSSALGFMTVPMMMAGEMYPLQVRGLLSGTTLALTNLLLFLINQFYPTLRSIIGFQYTILLFASFALFACMYFYYALPEMSKLKLHEIEEFYRTAHERENQAALNEHPLNKA